MRFKRLFIIGCLAQSLPAAAAGLPGPEDCRKLDGDQERLACYDKFFPRDLARGVVEKNPGQVAESSAQDRAEAQSSNPAAVEEFGAEQVIQPIDHLEARLVGDFTGWSGNTRFRLDNGQVWQQTKNYIEDYKPRETIPQPQVTISRGLMGSYNLRVEGVKRIVQVKRIK